ncbi:MAG TPA: hypothetical protein VG871_23905, partial [Vicinamibacterales bacterium]|nr:hypothetical protein [Vicinamibacterales bacterium]
MRSFLLAVAVAMLAVPACSNDITGGSGGTTGDDDGGGGGGGGGATCTCPDGTVLQSDSCATDCPTPSSPSISLAVSQSSIGGSTPVELGVETDLTVTVTSVMGFTGPVTLSATAVGSDGSTPVTDWTLAFDNANLSLAADGDSATATLGVEAMGDTAALAGTIMVTASAGSASPAAPIAVTFEPQLHIEFSNDANGNCVYPPGH